MTDDAEAQRTFTEDEMRDYNPQPCQTCGQPTMQYEFEDTADSHGLPRVTFVLARSICTQPNCASRGGSEGAEGTEAGTGSSTADGAVV